MIGFNFIDQSLKRAAIGLSIDAARLKKAVQRRLREAGNVVKERQKLLLRAGEGPKWGTTPKSMKIKRGEKRKSPTMSLHKVVLRLRSHNQAKRMHDYELLIGVPPGGDAFYAKFTETGTKERVTKSGHPTGAVRQRRWWGPAAEQTEAEVQQIIGRSFRAMRISD